MDKSLEEARALAEAARLRQVVDRLRDLAATTTAELAANRVRTFPDEAIPKERGPRD
ncbi:MAG: hypothetical protein ACRDZ3_16130 [Acidimicrobiia bacterium]